MGAGGGVSTGKDKERGFLVKVEGGLPCFDSSVIPACYSEGGALLISSPTSFLTPTH